MKKFNDRANVASTLLFLYMIVSYIRATDCTCDTSAMTTTSATVYMYYANRVTTHYDYAVMPLDDSNAWTWGKMIDFGVPTTNSECTMATSIELDATANGGKDIGGLALESNLVNASSIGIEYGTNTFKIKGAATSNDGGASANCESSSITITFSCAKINI